MQRPRRGPNAVVVHLQTSIIRYLRLLAVLNDWARPKSEWLYEKDGRIESRELERCL